MTDRTMTSDDREAMLWELAETDPKAAMELCGIMRARGDRAGARLALTDAVGSLDGDALETMFLDRDLAVPEGLSQEQAWALRDACWKGTIGGLADWASLMRGSTAGC